MSFADAVADETGDKWNRRLEDTIPDERYQEFVDGLERHDRERRKSWVEIAALVEREFGVACKADRVRRCFDRLKKRGELDRTPKVLTT